MVCTIKKENFYLPKVSDGKFAELFLCQTFALYCMPTLHVQVTAGLRFFSIQLHGLGNCEDGAYLL